LRIAEQGPSAQRVAVLEQIPGHPATAAEVWVRAGAVPGVGGGEGPWVVLRADDWPMSPSAARRLAAALVDAAARADRPG
jgi:hypothetical protein